MTLRFLQEIRCLITIIYLLCYSRPLLQDKRPKRAAILKTEPQKTPWYKWLSQFSYHSFNHIEINAQLDLSVYRACKNTCSLSSFIPHIWQRTEVSKNQKLFLDSMERGSPENGSTTHDLHSPPEVLIYRLCSLQEESRASTLVATHKGLTLSEAMQVFGILIKFSPFFCSYHMEIHRELVQVWELFPTYTHVLPLKYSDKV